MKLEGRHLSLPFVYSIMVMKKAVPEDPGTALRIFSEKRIRRS